MLNGPLQLNRERRHPARKTMGPAVYSKHFRGHLACKGALERHCLSVAAQGQLARFRRRRLWKDPWKVSNLSRLGHNRRVCWAANLVGLANSGLTQRVPLQRYSLLAASLPLFGPQAEARFYLG